MVESVLPRNTLRRFSFTNLLQMEDAFNSHPFSIRNDNWNKKSSQENLYQQLVKLFPDEGINYYINLILKLFNKKYLKNINILNS